MNIEDCTLYDKWGSTPFHHFYGWDYSELLWKWNIYYDMELFDGDEHIQWLIDRCLHDIMFKGGLSRFGKVMLKDIKDYLTILSNMDTYSAPFWKGMLNVENDFEFLRLFSNNVGYAWT